MNATHTPAKEPSTLTVWLIAIGGLAVLNIGIPALAELAAGLVR